MKHFAPYILMLEDDNDDRHITQTIFSEKGYKIDLEFLTDANEVSSFLENCIEQGLRLPHLIILDKNVPAVSGMHALKAIKSNPAFAMIPVVMISGSAFPAEVRESYRLGVNSFILKPATAAQTEQTIQSFVNYWFDTVELPALNVAAAAF